MGVGLDRCYDKIKEVSNFMDTLYNYPILFEQDDYVLQNAKRTSSIQFQGADDTSRRYIHLIEYDVIFE